MKDVPREINDILLKIDSELDSLRHMTIAVIDEKSDLQKLTLIENIRNKLSLLDAKYEDCYTVLVRYMKVAIDSRLQQMFIEGKEKEKNSDKQSNG